MKKIIDKMAYKLIGNKGWRILPLVPGTAQFSYTSSTEDKGRLEKFEVSAILRKTIRELSLDLQLYIAFDDLTEITLGTEDLPARFKVEDKDGCSISMKYERTPIL